MVQEAARAEKGVAREEEEEVVRIEDQKLFQTEQDLLEVDGFALVQLALSLPATKEMDGFSRRKMMDYAREERLKVAEEGWVMPAYNSTYLRLLYPDRS